MKTLTGMIIITICAFLFGLSSFQIWAQCSAPSSFDYDQIVMNESTQFTWTSVASASDYTLNFIADGSLVHSQISSTTFVSISFSQMLAWFDPDDANNKVEVFANCINVTNPTESSSIETIKDIIDEINSIAASANKTNVLGISEVTLTIKNGSLIISTNLEDSLIEKISLWNLNGQLLSQYSFIKGGEDPKKYTIALNEGLFDELILVSLENQKGIETQKLYVSRF